MQDEIADSFVETIRDSDLKDAAIELTDAASSGLPIFSTIAKLLGGVQSVHNYYYTKKVMAFLTELKSIPKEERQRQIAKIVVVPGEREKFGEHIALMLDRVNAVRKATLMGKVAKAFLEERISRDDLESLNAAIDVLDLRVINYLKGAVDHYDTSTPQDQHLAQCGLMAPELKVETEGMEITEGGFTDEFTPNHKFKAFKSAGIYYNLTEIGRLFIEVCLS